ncbi:MAG: hypothetical protein H7X89_09365 [Rhizobiales bacterium]|nr:hypothetical protein [Hyphomicrobiales bacterium]
MGEFSCRSKQHGRPALTPDITVLYIAGHGRSGSTLVGSVLGLADGYVYVGEARDVWRDGLIANENCGCGQKFRDCPFWTAVFERAFGGFDTPEAQSAGRRINRINSWREKLPLLWLAWRFPRGHGASNGYTRPLTKLYTAIRDVSGASVIVDTSKTMRYGALVAATPGLDVKLTNLIRDPRGIMFSRLQRARYRDGSLKPSASGYRQSHVFRIIGKWMLRNALAARVLRRNGGVRLRYEDFVKDQGWYLRTTLGDEAAKNVVRKLAEGTGRDAVQHQIAGNWVRELKISPSERWRTELPWFQRSLAGVLSAPLRCLYRSQAFHTR